MTHIIAPQEQWTKHNFSSLLNGKYYLTGIKDDLNALDIFLRQENGQQEIKITYASAFSYCNTCETIRMGIVDELNKRYGASFYLNWSFFKIENSTYIEWLKKQSYNYAADFNLQHFVIMGMDYIIDIVAQSNPQITILT